MAAHVCADELGVGWLYAYIFKSIKSVAARQRVASWLLTAFTILLRASLDAIKQQQPTVEW